MEEVIMHGVLDFILCVHHGDCNIFEYSSLEKQFDQTAVQLWTIIFILFFYFARTESLFRPSHPMNRMATAKIVSAIKNLNFHHLLLAKFVPTFFPDRRKSNCP